MRLLAGLLHSLLYHRLKVGQAKLWRLLYARAIELRCLRHLVFVKLAFLESNPVLRGGGRLRFDRQILPVLLLLLLGRRLLLPPLGFNDDGVLDWGTFLILTCQTGFAFS